MPIDSGLRYRDDCGWYAVVSGVVVYDKAVGISGDKDDANDDLEALLWVDGLDAEVLDFQLDLGWRDFLYESPDDWKLCNEPGYYESRMIH